MGNILRRTMRIALAATLILGSGPLFPAQRASAAFTDTAESYARQEIEALAQAGILSGYEDGTFQPGKTTTRAEAARVIALAMGLAPHAAGAGAFSDVAGDAWYRGYVGALVQAGIAHGTAPDRFSPEAPVSREQLVVFFVRAFGLEAAANKLPDKTGIADFADVADWAKPHVALAVQAGFVKGIEQPGGGLLFRPKATADRQALARLAYEYKANQDVYAQRMRDLSDSLPDEEEGEAPALAASVVEVTVVDSTTIRVAFDSAVAAASAEDFRFEPELAVTSAVFPEGSDAVIVLTTGVQAPGVSYNLLYKGQDTGLAAIGTGAGAAPASADSDDEDERDNTAALLASGGSVANATIRTSGVYGPSDGSGLTTAVTGTLTIDPGQYGEVTLRHIDPENLVVLSGNNESIKLMQTIVKQLRVNAVNNNGRDVRIEVRDGVNIDDTFVESQAVLESASTSGRLGNIKLTAAAAGKTVTLRGDIQGDVTVDAPGSSIRLEAPSTGSGASATALRALLLLTSAKIELANDTGISTVQLGGDDTSLEIEGDGAVGTVVVDPSATGASLNLGPGASVGTIEAEADIRLSGDAEAIAGTKVEGGGAVAVDDAVKEEVKAKAIDKAVAAIEAITPFSVYSTELQAAIDAAARLVDLALVYGAEDTDIGNLGDLEAIRTTVDALKTEVEQDAEALTVASTATDDITLPIVGTSGSSTIEWASSRNDVIQPSGEVARPGVGQPAAVVTLTATVSKLGYALTRNFTVTVPAEGAVVPTVVGIVYDRVVTVAPEVQLQLEIAVLFSDDTTVDVTASAENWTSSHPGVATISPTGLLTGVANGITTVTATYDGLTAEFEVAVMPEGELTYSILSIRTSPTSDNPTGGSSITNAGANTYTIPAHNTHEYLVVMVGGLIDDDAYLDAIVAGLNDAQAVDFHLLYLVIHHGGLEAGTYPVAIGGLKRTVGGSVSYVKPLRFTIVKQ